MMDKFTLPADSPLRSAHLHRLLLFSLLVQHSVWHLLANTVLKGSHNLKKRSWILTTMAAIVMSLASLPFLKDLVVPPDVSAVGAATVLRGLNLTMGLWSSSALQHLHRVLSRKAANGLLANANWHFFSLDQIQPRTTTVTHPLCAYFIAYLLSDMALGGIYYPTMMNMASGWVHHTAYTFFFAYWIHRGWAHIAATAAIFELPTAIMGIACLYPPLRSNIGFTVTFFATRVFLHFGLLCATFTEAGRNAPGIDGSWGPFISVAVTYPMHLFWGYKCILSVRKRMRKRALSKKAALEEGKAAITAGTNEPVDGTKSVLSQATEVLQKRRRPTLAEQLRIQLPSIAVGAGRFFNGLAPPDAASALNTPALTPTGGSVPVYANFGSAAPVAALSKAAKAAANRLGRGRKRSTSSITGSTSEPETEPESLGSSSAVERLSWQRNPKRHSTGGSSTPFGTSAVAPLDAAPDALDKTPFLAIRSQAETTDRARRLVADAVRKAWAQRAPESWKREWEEEERRERREREKRAKRRAEAISAKKAARERSQQEPMAITTGTASSSSTAASSRIGSEAAGRTSLDGTTYVADSSSQSSVSADDVDSIFEDAVAGGEHLEPASYTDVESSAWSGLGDDDFDDATSALDADFEAVQLTKMEARKAAARRAIIRAVRRAINGREPAEESENEHVKEDETLAQDGADSTDGEDPIDEGDFFAQAARQQRQAERAAAKARSSRSKRRRLFFDRALARLDWDSFVKLLPPEFSRDQDSFVVRELQVESIDGPGERRKRIVDELRRRMEIARRDVVICD